LSRDLDRLEVDQHQLCGLKPDLILMISTARSFWLRLASPAVLYQTDSARARGVMVADDSRAICAE
jgi:hypothetical protein